MTKLLQVDGIKTKIKQVYKLIQPGIDSRVLFSGCGSDTSGTNTDGSTLDSRSALSLKIIDAVSQDVLSPETVTFTVDDVVKDPITCSVDQITTKQCDNLVLAYELAGEYEFTVTADGYQDQS